MRVGKPLASKRWMTSTPVFPATMELQVEGTSFPSGVMSPNPVMATRRFSSLPAGGRLMLATSLAHPQGKLAQGKLEAPARDRLLRRPGLEGQLKGSVGAEDFRVDLEDASWRREGADLHVPDFHGDCRFESH